MSDVQGTFPLATTASSSARFLLIDGGVTKEMTPSALATLVGGGGGGGGGGSYDLEAGLLAASVNSITARQIQRLAGFVEFNVLHYGADRLGVTDSTAAFQACINAVLTNVLATGGGCNVYVPAGRYKLSDTLTLGTAGASPSQRVKGFRFHGDNWGASGNYGLPYAQGGTFLEINYPTARPFMTINTPWLEGLCQFDNFTVSAQYSAAACTKLFTFPNNSFVAPYFENIQALSIGTFIHVGATAINGEFGILVNCAASLADCFMEIEHGESYGWMTINSGMLGNPGAVQFKLGAATNTGAGIFMINTAGGGAGAGTKTDGSRNFCFLENHGASPTHIMGGRIEHVSCLLTNTSGYNKVTFTNVDIAMDTQSSVTSPAQTYPYAIQLTSDSSTPGIGGSTVQFNNCRIAAEGMDGAGAFIKDFPIYNHDNVLKFENTHFSFFKANAPVVTQISGPMGGFTEFKDCFVSEGTHFDGNQYNQVPYNDYHGTHFWDSAKRGRRSSTHLPMGRQNNLLLNPHIVAYADDLSGTAATVLTGWTLSSGAAFPTGAVLTRGSDTGIRARSSHPDARKITLATSVTLTQTTALDLGTFPAAELNSFAPYSSVGIPTVCYHAKIWPVSGNLRIRLKNSVTGDIFRELIIGDLSQGPHDIQLPAVCKAPAATQYLQLELAAVGAAAVFYLDHHFLTSQVDGTYANGAGSAVAGTEYWSTNAASVAVHSRFQAPYKVDAFGSAAATALGDLRGGELYLSSTDFRPTIHYSDKWGKMTREFDSPDSTAAPTTGTWKVGDKAKRVPPATGQVEYWVCTVAGTPGTWKAGPSLA